MTYDALDPHSVTLRLEFSIADAVVQRGLVPVLIEAFRAWWKRPRLPPNLPAYLRVDVGLPAEDNVVYWMDIPIHPHSVVTPDPLRRPGM
ncbi:MAG: hypothetical protein JWR51_1008 [Devosia sp.]|uniref:hypothetical protein n=1 Tax=Devosia sp. TaxID=1871048 RepID=UPI002630CC9C|nr:hypothetical protein [Devosia sp.]MDB5527905.1 hypothetical protein [Devosia sp.]